MHDPMTQICSFPSYDQQEWMRKQWWIPAFISNFTLFTLWHNDPCKDGTDESCGWFMRARHGNKETLKRIINRFEFDWDRIFTPSKEDDATDGEPHIERTYFCGFFKPDGSPNLSVQAIALNLFFLAAHEHFRCDGRTNWTKSKRWMRENMMDMVLFAENPTDSLFDTITRKFEIGCREPHTPRRRQQRIENMASCIYAWILRKERPWYKHPRWHIHHWSVQIHFWQTIKRWLFERCSICKKGFHWKESVCGSWSGNEIWHDRCQSDILVNK